MSPSPSFTRTASCTGEYPCDLNHVWYAAASPARSWCLNRTPSTVPSITVAPLAANTMSGSPATGSIVDTECPSDSYVARSAAHCRIAASGSTGAPGRIHGLIA
jgi:hypothetical protein